MPSHSSSHWLSLVGAIWLQTINGPNSDFPVYSSQLKDLKDISQIKLNFLAFASDAGKLFGWFSGLAALYLPLWFVAVIGAAFGLIGYGVQYLFLDSSGLSYWHLFVLTSLAGNGICWINTVCYLICIKNFPSDSRVAVGLSTSYVGLSAKVYTTLSDAIFHPKTNQSAKSYLLLNAVVPMLITALVAPFLRVVEAIGETQTDSVFVVMFVITLATGICAVIGSIGSESNGLSSREHMLSMGILLALPLAVPVVVKLRESIGNILGDKREIRVYDETVEDLEAGSVVTETEVKEEVERFGESQEVGGLEMLKTLDFWLYFFSYMFSATLGLVFLNNLGQIAESRRLLETSTLVSLSSSFGFFGRLLPSFLDYYSSKRGYMVLSRSGSMAALMVPMAAAFFLLLIPNTFVLYMSTSIIGACTGAITSIAVSATSELFGTKNFGVNHNIVVTNIPIGSFCFGYLAAFLYQTGAGGSQRCYGSACYKTSFIIWGSVCSFAAVLCTVLYRRSRPVLFRDHPQKINTTT